MTAWIIHLDNGRGETTVEADCYNVHDRALTMLEIVGTRSSDRHTAQLMTFAAGTWLTIFRADLLDPLPDTAQPTAAPRPTRILPAHQRAGVVVPSDNKKSTTRNRITARCNGFRTRRADSSASSHRQTGLLSLVSAGLCTVTGP